MQTQNQVHYRQAGTGRVLWGPGERHTFLITGAETNGTLFMAEVSVVPGGGPPPHIHHREDESIYLQRGTLAIQAGDTTMNASSGDFAYLPRGVAHSFRNTGEEDATILVVCTPAGLEKFFEETFVPTADRFAAPAPPSNAMIARFMAAATKYGLELLRPAPETSGQ